MKPPAIGSFLFACGMLMALGGTAHAAGDPAAGKKKNTACIGCHGIEGYRTSYPTVYNVPRLGGQHAEYLVKALQAYKDGNRNHPTMKAIADTLTQQDMEDLAAYYSGASGK
ncbi:Cytochrome c553 [Nitrosovibrio sp. Nv6]|nr:Cytochrome c553 [Nitrosovibrio sp. Nv6]